MDMIALSPFIRNPYRILGLNGAAGRVAIDEAAHALEEALLQRSPKETPWDIPWLGPLDREEADIEYAVRRLEDPSLRLRERLMWFHEGENLLRGLSPESIDSVVSKWSKIERPSARHDAALLAVIAALYLDSEIKDEGRWLNAMSMWNEALATDSYWSGVVDIESEGGFASAAMIQDISRIKNVAGVAVADIVVAIAKDAAGRTDASLVRRALNLLRRAPLPEKAIAGKENEILSMLEEQLYALCAELRRQCSDDIQQDGRSIDANKLVCKKALDRLNTELLPKLDFILGLEGPDTPAALRARERATFCIHGLAMDHVWAEEYSTVQRLLEQARDLAPIDSIILGRIEESMATVAEKLRQAEAAAHVHTQVHGAIHDQVAWKPIPESTLKKKMSPELKGVLVAASVGIAVAAYIILGTGKAEKQPPLQIAQQEQRPAVVEHKPLEAPPPHKTQQQPIVAPPTRKELPHLTRKDTSTVAVRKEAHPTVISKKTAAADVMEKRPTEKPVKPAQPKRAEVTSKKPRAETFVDETPVKARDAKKRQQKAKISRRAENAEMPVKAALTKKPPAQTADSEIKRLRTSLDKLMAELDALRAKIDARKGIIADFEQRINSGAAVDKGAYNKTLSDYNALVRKYNEQLAKGRKIAADLDRLGG